MDPISLEPPVPAEPRRGRRYRSAAVAAASVTGALALVAGGIEFAGSAAQAASSMYVAPYVDMSNSNESILNTVASSDGLHAYTAAFAIGEGCSDIWGDTLPIGSDPTIGGEISTAKADGAQVIVSSGGADGYPMSFTCSTQSTIDAAYQAIINDYGTDYLDFDIEGAAEANTAGIDQTIQAMKDLKSSNPGLVWSMTLPVLPSGLTNYGTALLQDAKNMGVTIPIVNIMTMDYYEGTGLEMGSAAIQAAQSTLSQMKAVNSSYTYANVGITPMIGVNDDGSTFTLADATTVANWAGSNGIGRLAFWSVDRDNGGCAGGGAASSTCSGVSQSTGQFTKNFLGGSGGGGTSPSSSPTRSSSPSASPTPTSGGGGGSCFAAWSASTSYVPGNQVSYSGVNYTAIYWSTDVPPTSAIAWDIWQSDGAC
jgi:chitinase